MLQFQGGQVLGNDFRRQMEQERLKQMSGAGRYGSKPLLPWPGQDQINQFGHRQLSPNMSGRQTMYNLPTRQTSADRPLLPFSMSPAGQPRQKFPFPNDIFRGGALPDWLGGSSGRPQGQSTGWDTMFGSGLLSALGGGIAGGGLAGMMGGGGNMVQNAISGGQNMIQSALGGLMGGGGMGGLFGGGSQGGQQAQSAGIGRAPQAGGDTDWIKTAVDIGIKLLPLLL